MTVVHERTRSVVQTEQFLRDIMRNKSVPESLRIQAESLLRHYPDADKIWRAGRQEKWQRNSYYFWKKGSFAVRVRAFVSVRTVVL